jgi:hypothetical protein
VPPWRVATQLFLYFYIKFIHFKTTAIHGRNTKMEDIKAWKIRLTMRFRVLRDLSYRRALNLPYFLCPAFLFHRHSESMFSLCCNFPRFCAAMQSHSTLVADLNLVEEEGENTRV